MVSRVCYPEGFPPTYVPEVYEKIVNKKYPALQVWENPPERYVRDACGIPTLVIPTYTHYHLGSWHVWTHLH